MISNRQLFLRHVAQTSAHSLLFEVSRAEGICFYDRENRPYYDLVSGVSVSNLGHNHPVVVEAVKKQAELYMHTMVYGEFVQSPQVGYARWVTSHLPGTLDNVFFVNSGSEAIEGAMKLAKRVTGRSDIISFEKAYHGGTQGALSILGSSRFRSGFLPLLPGIKHIRFNEPGDLDQINETTAAVVVEPIQAEAGIIEPEDGFLKKIRERCNATGTLLVLDEVQTGQGRTGTLYAFEQYGIVPDILCLAKSFGGGMPLGAFISSREMMESLTRDPPLGHITTFGGHPVCCAAGLAAAEYIVKHALQDHALLMGQRYREALKHAAIEEVRGKGLFLGVKLGRKFPVDLFIREAFQEGLVIDKFLFCEDAFRIAPPLIIREDEVDDTVRIIKGVLDRIRE